MAVGSRVALALKTAEFNRPLCASADDLLRLENLFFVCLKVAADDAHLVAEQSRAALAIFGRVVAENDGNGRQRGAALAGSEAAGDQVAAEQVERGIGIASIDYGRAYLDEVADLDRTAPAEHGSGIGAGLRLLGRAQDRIADPRGEDRAGVFVGHEVDLDAIVTRPRKGHWREGRAQQIADRNGIVVLALRVAANGDPIEPRVEAGVLEDAAAELPGLVLAPVVDQPAAADEVAVEVVEVIALAVDVDVAPKLILSVVGVLPLPPAVFVEKLLGNVPFLDCWIERTK